MKCVHVFTFCVDEIVAPYLFSRAIFHVVNIDENVYKIKK